MLPASRVFVGWPRGGIGCPGLAMSTAESWVPWHTLKHAGSITELAMALALQLWLLQAYLAHHVGCRGGFYNNYARSS